jgi:hypothetical protein
VDNRLFVEAVPLCPKKLRILRSTFCAIQIELLPFIYPMTCATAYFGGIEISICT